MPGWLRAFAEHQPVTQVANALRELSHGGPTGHAVSYALIWSGGILLVASVLATWRFRKV
jgi:ABC-2 type transport system permease protein/oleandomycin transport system permease protein